MVIESVFIRNITQGDFWNIERRNGQGPITGGGQTYFDIPLGQIPLEKLFKFLNIENTEANINIPPSKDINIKTIGNITQESTINFSYRTGNNRYKISNQNRHKDSSARPHCWTEANYFPTLSEAITSKDDIPTELFTNLKIFIVKTSNGDYFGGFFNQEAFPNNWTNVPELKEIFDSRNSANLFEFNIINKELVNILNAWNTKPNILLYGPPGTGKTYLMNKAWEILSKNDKIKTLSLNHENRENPFEAYLQLPFKKPTKTKWITFHQNYSYEDFILALIPDSNSATLKLKARAGSLLDSAIQIDEKIIEENNLEKFDSAVIFIDEINRGNVSRIFGEFITFMDMEYRQGNGNNPLPVPINNISIDESLKTESILLSNGREIKIQLPWYMPKNIYILASMNSVDKAVAPLDSALERRFNKVSIMPNINQLANILNTDSIQDIISKKETNPDFEPNASEIAVSLLYRVNYIFSSFFGKDNGLGQSSFYTITHYSREEDKILEIVKIWEQFIFPQVQEKFMGRTDEIFNILRLDKEDEVPVDFVYKFKKAPLNTDLEDQRTFNQLEDISLLDIWKTNAEGVKNTLKYIAGF